MITGTKPTPDQPYFTTDLRQMTGRYYRVTVDKCGWLIDDYLNL